MEYLIDTNVVSELLKKQPHAGMLQWLETHDRSLYISSITIEELKFGALYLPDGKRKRALVAAIDALLDTYRPFIWSFDGRAAETCARLHVQTIKAGRTPSIEDLMIAAIAQSHNASVVTRNFKDFAYLDIPTINPFEGDS